MNNSSPDLEFVAEGTKSIGVPEGKLAEFCPLIFNCDGKNTDENCFYSKFLHCKSVEKYIDKLSKEDIDYRNGKET